MLSPTESLVRSSLRRKLAAAIFVLLIFAPLFISLRDIALDAGSVRDKERAPAPSFPSSLSEWAALPGQFKWYFAQRFGLKPSLITLYGWISVRIFGQSPTQSVLLGDDGWLFLAGERVLDYHRHSEPLGSERAERWVRVLAERQAALKLQGRDYAFVVAPNAQSIYPEKIANDLAPLSEVTRLDELLTAASRVAPQLHLIDLRAPLLPHRNEVRMFFKADTHWSPAAAWLGAREVGMRLGLGVLPGELTPARLVPSPSGDLARLMGLSDFYTDEEVWPAATPGQLVDEAGAPVSFQLIDILERERVVAINPAGKGSAVIFRDSAADAMIPWLSSLFQRTVWVWSYELLPDVIEQEQPTVVIEQVIERRLMTLEPAAAGTPGR